MFMSATIQTIVAGTPTQAGSSWMPTNGNVKRSIQTPNATGIAAASDLPAELLPPRRARGSRRPRRPSSRPPRRAAARASRRRAARNASAGTRMPRKSAIPPSRGTGSRVQAAALGPVDRAEHAAPCRRPPASAASTITSASTTAVDHLRGRRDSSVPHRRTSATSSRRGGRPRRRGPGRCTRARSGSRSIAATRRSDVRVLALEALDALRRGDQAIERAPTARPPS